MARQQAVASKLKECTLRLSKNSSLSKHIEAQTGQTSVHRTTTIEPQPNSFWSIGYLYHCINRFNDQMLTPAGSAQSCLFSHRDYMLACICPMGGELAPVKAM